MLLPQKCRICVFALVFTRVLPSLSAESPKMPARQGKKAHCRESFRKPVSEAEDDNAILRRLGGLTDKGILAGKVVRVSPAYEYAVWIRRQLRNPSFSPSKDKGSWIDRQQLFYLADPTMHILHEDNDLTQRASASSQLSRMLRLTTVRAEAARKSATPV